MDNREMSDCDAAGTNRKREHAQSTAAVAAANAQRQQPAPSLVCVICGNGSNGIHFGRPSCRACAAFFRRTISQNQTYICKRNGNCEIADSARNICRFCRFNKCLRMGMNASAVQNNSNSNNDDRNVSVVDVPSDAGLNDINNVPDQSSMVPKPTFQPTTFQNGLGAKNHDQNVVQAKLSFDSISSFSTLSTPSWPAPPNHNNNNNNASSICCSSPCTPSSTCMELRHLPRILEGYRNLLALKMSSIAMLDDKFPLRNVIGIGLDSMEEIPRSNFDNCKKVCIIAISLAFNTLERFFFPFNQLPIDDKRKLFKGFFQLFCNTNRAFRTYKRFPPGDDRLLMPDEGCVRFSELHLFFANCTMVTGDPVQLADLFRNSIQYLLYNVVPYMRSIEMQELELMALACMFLWNDSNEVSTETQLVARQIRNEIIVDLHNYYRGLGLSEQEITLKTANLFLLIPKLENAVKMMAEDTTISDMFNLLTIDEPCRSYAIV